MMRELSHHEIDLVAGGATAIFQEVAKAALAGAAKGVSPPLTYGGGGLSSGTGVLVGGPLLFPGR
jgi:hypothetical protein